MLGLSDCTVPSAVFFEKQEKDNLPSYVHRYPKKYFRDFALESFLRKTVRNQPAWRAGGGQLGNLGSPLNLPRASFDGDDGHTLALESPPVKMHTLEHTRDAAAKWAEVTPLSKEKHRPVRFLSYQIRLLDITPEQLESVVATLDTLGVCHHVKRPYAEKTQLEMEDQVKEEKKRFKRMREEDEQGEWIEILRPFG